MRTSASCRERGFTLIEITVVMVLMGLLYAIAAPALGKLYARLGYSADLNDTLAQITALPVRVYATGEEGTLEALAERHLTLPEGWTLAGADAIYLRPNGVCSGGTVRLQTPLGVRDLVLEPPFCGARATP